MSVESRDPTVPNQTVLGSDFVCRQIKIFFFSKWHHCEMLELQILRSIACRQKTGPPNQITEERTLGCVSACMKEDAALPCTRAVEGLLPDFSGWGDTEATNEQTGSNCAPLWHLVLTQKVSVGSGQKTLGPRWLKGSRKRGAAPAR